MLDSTRPDALAILDGLEATKRLRMALTVPDLANACEMDEGLLHPDLAVPSVPGAAPSPGFYGIEGFRNYFKEAEDHGFLAQAAIHTARVTEAGNVLASGSLLCTVDAKYVNEVPAWFVYRFCDNLVSAIETYVGEDEALEAAASLKPGTSAWATGLRPAGPAAATPESDTRAEKVVRRAWLDFHDRGPSGMLAHCTEDVCWQSLLADGRTAKGREGIEAMYDGLADIGMSHTAVPYRYGCVNGRVIVSVDVCVSQGSSRVPDYHAYVVYHLRGDKIERLCEYLTPEEALAAAKAPLPVELG